MFFTNGCWCSLPRGWGVPIYNWKNLKKWKTKKLKRDYVQFKK